MSKSPSSNNQKQETPKNTGQRVRVTLQPLKDEEKPKVPLPKVKIRPKSHLERDLYFDDSDLGYKLRHPGCPDMRCTNLDSLLGFNLETRVRMMVSDCINTLETKVEAHNDRLGVIEQGQRRQHGQISEIGYVLQKTIQRSSALEEVHQTILLMENERKVSEQSLITDIGSNKAIIRETQERVLGLEELIRQEKRQREFVKKDLHQMKTDIHQFKDSLSNEHIQFRMDMTNRQDKFISDLNKIKEQCDIDTSRINAHRDALKNSDAIASAFRTNILELYEKLEEFSSAKMDKTGYETELMQIRRDLQNCKLLNEDTYNSLVMTDNYLDTYLKVEFLNHIVETLFLTITDIDQLQRIKDFAEQKFKVYQQQIHRKEQGNALQGGDGEDLDGSFEQVQQKNMAKQIAQKLLGMQNQAKLQNGGSRPSSRQSSSKSLPKVPDPPQQPKKSTFSLTSRLTNLNKVGYRLSTIAHQQDNAYQINYEYFNGLKDKGQHVERKFEDKQQQQFVMSPIGFKMHQQQEEDNFETLQEELIDNVPDYLNSNTKSSGEFIMPMTPRSASKRKPVGSMRNRPTIKKIVIANNTQAAKKLSELQEKQDRQDLVLKVSETKHLDHQHKINSLEDLDDELKEVVLQSQEHIQDLYKKHEDSQHMFVELKRYTEYTQTLTLQQVDQLLATMKELLHNMQMDMEEDLKRRIREKSNFDIQLKRHEEGIERMGEREQKNEQVLGMVMESLKVLYNVVKGGMVMTKQDESDRETIQLLGMQSQVTGGKKVKNKLQGVSQQQILNSVLTGISTDHSSGGEDPNQHLQASTTLLPNHNHQTSTTHLQNHLTHHQQHQQAKPVITLDRNCMSCSPHHQNVVMSAFKIACLQYQPQKVNFNNELIERVALIEKCQQELEYLGQTPFMKSLQFVNIQNQSTMTQNLPHLSILRNAIKEEDSLIMNGNQRGVDRWATQSLLNDGEFETNNTQQLETSKAPYEITITATQPNIKRNLPELKRMVDIYQSSQPKTARSNLTRNNPNMIGHLSSYNTYSREPTLTLSTGTHTLTTPNLTNLRPQVMTAGSPSQLYIGASTALNKKRHKTPQQHQYNSTQSKFKNNQKIPHEEIVSSEGQGQMMNGVSTLFNRQSLVQTPQNINNIGKVNVRPMTMINKERQSEEKQYFPLQSVALISTAQQSKRPLKDQRKTEELSQMTLPEVVIIGNK